MAAHTTGIPATPDIVIIGAGAVGLWCALKARQRGLSAVVLDKSRIGQGASGGLLGALMPHRPVQWTDTKAFQLAALLSLETEIADLEAETGLSCGYARCGRVMPVSSLHHLADHEQWQAAAAYAWPVASPSGQSLTWDIVRGRPDPGWPALTPGFTAYSFDTLSARLNPRKLLAALAHGIGADVVVAENRVVNEVCRNGEVVLADGIRLSPGRVIVAAGHESFGLLQPLLPGDLGWGVKGQAVLLRPVKRCFDGMPIIYDRGTYVIAHEDGLVAVGSTSQRNFSGIEVDEVVSQSLVERADNLCPGLAGAEVLEQWAGVRPRAAGRDPMVGPVPYAPNVIVASGGFKITLGIAHKMADAALDLATGRGCELPRGFSVPQHVAKLVR